MGGDGSGPDGDALGDGSNTDGNVECDPAVRDCDDVCACDGPALEDDCVEHQCASGCTEAQGYWKTSDAAWPVAELTLGVRVYDVPTMLMVMELPTEGDASVTLATHLIATRLNLAAGVVDPELTGELEAADAWLAANDDDEDGLPLAVPAGDDRSREALLLAAELADFNAGVVGPGLCTPEDDGEDGAETDTSG